MEFNNTFFLVLFCFTLLFPSIPISLSEPSQPQKTYKYLTSTPPILIPRLETWARAMQLSFRSISEPPSHSQSEFQSQSSGMVSIPYRGTSESLLPTPLQPLPSSNSPSINLLDTNITVNTICQKTEFPSQCISTVSPFLKEISDISTILDRTMKSIQWLIKLGSIHAQRLSNTPGSPKDETKILKFCKDNYDNAFSDFQEAMKSFACKDMERMNSMLKAVLSEIEDCRDEYSWKIFPLATYDDKITKMTSNCLAIVDMVHQHR